jgi:hypothetical protein
MGGSSIQRVITHGKCEVECEISRTVHSCSHVVVLIHVSGKLTKEAKIEVMATGGRVIVVWLDHLELNLSSIGTGAQVVRRRI